MKTSKFVMSMSGNIHHSLPLSREETGGVLLVQDYWKINDSKVPVDKYIKEANWHSLVERDLAGG